MQREREREREEWEMGDTRTDRQADSECRIGGAVRLRGVFRWCCSLANCCSLSFNSFRFFFSFCHPLLAFPITFRLNARLLHRLLTRKVSKVQPKKREKIERKLEGHTRNLDINQVINMFNLCSHQVRRTSQRKEGQQSLSD